MQSTYASKPRKYEDTASRISNLTRNFFLTIGRSTTKTINNPSSHPTRNCLPGLKTLASGSWKPSGTCWLGDDHAAASWGKTTADAAGGRGGRLMASWRLWRCWYRKKAAAIWSPASKLGHYLVPGGDFVVGERRCAGRRRAGRGVVGAGAAKSAREGGDSEGKALVRNTEGRTADS
jgi:hypothetical protein